MNIYAVLILLVTCVRCQNNYYNGQNIKPRISLEFDMPLTELVDTCHSYAEQKGRSTFPFLSSVYRYKDVIASWLLKAEN